MRKSSSKRCARTDLERSYAADGARRSSRFSRKSSTTRKSTCSSTRRLTEKTPGADAGQAYIYPRADRDGGETGRASQQTGWTKSRPTSQRICRTDDPAQLIAKKGKIDEARQMLASLESPDPHASAFSPAAMPRCCSKRNVIRRPKRAWLQPRRAPRTIPISVRLRNGSGEERPLRVMEAKLRQLIKRPARQPAGI